MTRNAEKRVIEHLEKHPPEGRTAEPPADLAERIRADVPPRLELAPEVRAEAGGGAGASKMPPRRWLAAAAVALVAVGAGVVGLRVARETGEPMRLEATEPFRGDGLATEGRAVPLPVPRPSEGEAATGERAADETRSDTTSRQDLNALGYTGGSADGSERRQPSDRLREQVAERAADVELERTPTAGDPWRVVTQTPGVLTDRLNVGGQERGQQAVRTAPEVEPEAKASGDSFEVDGTVITDMAAIGKSPPYYDFDQFEEIKVTGEAPPPPEPRNMVKGEVVPQTGPPPPADVAHAIPAPSTGGTDEPNDQPYGDVFFRGYGTNPFIDAEDDPLSTFALDVDTGSWGVVRRYLRDGNLPPREAVRVEEMVNAFDYGDPAPAEGDFRIAAEGSRSPFAPAGPAADRYHLLRFGLKAREVDTADRKPAVLTFVVDVSGSMSREDRLGLVKRALGLLLGELRSEDRVALVVYGSRGRVVLDHTGDLEAIRSAIDRLVPEGATNAEEGLVLAYDLARRAFREGAVNRVILCSDGVANVGNTGPESILERIGGEARRGIELTTVGFGMGNYNDVLMEQLADRGDGAYAYVDDLDEARRIFVEELTGTLQTVARQAKVQVELDPRVVARYRLVGYENRDVPDERFRDDSVDAGEVGAGHTVTALYEVKLREGVGPRARAAVLRLRWESVESGEVVEIERPVRVAELLGEWEEAPGSLKLASVVAELGEALKGTYWARDADLEDLFRRAQTLSAERPGDLEVAELATIVGRAARLKSAED